MKMMFQSTFLEDIDSLLYVMPRWKKIYGDETAQACARQFKHLFLAVDEANHITMQIYTSGRIWEVRSGLTTLNYSAILPTLDNINVCLVDERM